MTYTFKWCDAEWQCSMEGGRTVHPDHPWYRYSEDMVSLDDERNLLLTSNYNPKAVGLWDGQTYQTDYEVGLIRSVEAFPYGTFTAVMRLPKGKLLWPSFWLVGDGRWPDNGEIDVCEAYSNAKGSYFKPLLSWRTTTNIHYAVDGKHMDVGEKSAPWLKQTKNPTERFVNYEVEWRPNTVKFKINGKVTREVGWDTAKHLVGKRMHAVFNVWPQTPDFTQETPMAIHRFDYEPL